MPKLEDYLTIKAAAEYLGVCPNTLRNWDASGKIRVYRHPMSGYRLFLISDLDEVLRRIEQAGELPTGEKRRPTPKRKPR